MSRSSRPVTWGRCTIDATIFAGDKRVVIVEAGPATRPSFLLDHIGEDRAVVPGEFRQHASDSGAASVHALLLPAKLPIRIPTTVTRVHLT